MNAARRPCPRGHGIFRGSCPVCRRQREASRATARQRGYGTDWDAYSRGFLSRHPWCGERADGRFSDEHSRCVQRNERVPAAVTDHIVALADGGALMDPQNHQSLCVACNTAKSANRGR